MLNAVGNSTLTTVLGLAGILLGLSIFVQVTQEAWKYLLSTKSAAYRRALFQFLGPWARYLNQPGILADLQVGGPFRIFRQRPGGRLMPLQRDQLVEAMERTAPTLVRRTLEALRVEMAAALPLGQATSPTPGLAVLVSELTAVERGSPGYSTAQDILGFFDSWQVTAPQPAGDPARRSLASAPLNVTALTAAFRERFLGHVTHAERHFDQLVLNFDYIYRRRNTLLTVLIALAVTLLADLPVGRLYQRASAMTAEQASELAQAMTQLYDSLPPGTPANDSLRARAQRIRVRALELLNARAGLGIDPALATEQTWIGGAWRRVTAVWTRVTGRGALYLLECLITALLISFGAPFWNDLAGSLLRLQRGTRDPDAAEARAS